jgi:hypothetical protein
LHDAIQVEKAGTPAAAVMTDAFVETARALAAACGMPDYPFAVITHPIAADDVPALRVKAGRAAAQCAELLTTR